jgi:7-cyano-7-deazaguanine synthase
MKAVMLLSGGLDSSTLLHYEAYKGVEIYPVAFRYGQKHSIELSMCDKQVEAASKKYPGLIHELKTLDISFMKDLLKGSSALVDDSIEVPTLKQVIGEPQPVTYVPFRNALFLNLAMAYAEAVGAEVVYYGAQKQDEYSGYWDTTPQFVEAMNNVASLNRLHSIRIVAPFVDLHKSEEVIIGTYLDVDYADTWTSYKVVDEDNLIADASNPTSADRIKAFAEVGIPDPQKYDVEIPWTDLFKKNQRYLLVDGLESTFNFVETMVTH